MITVVDPREWETEGVTMTVLYLPPFSLSSPLNDDVGRDDSSSHRHRYKKRVPIKQWDLEENVDVKRGRRLLIVKEVRKFKFSSLSKDEVVGNSQRNWDGNGNF